MFPGEEKASSYRLLVLADKIKLFCDKGDLNQAATILAMAVNRGGWPAEYKDIILPRISEDLRYEELWIWNYSRLEFLDSLSQERGAAKND